MMGFSVISIAEVLYFVFLKPFFDMFKRRNPLVAHNKDIDRDVSIESMKSFKIIVYFLKFQTSTNDKLHHQMLFKRRKNINNRVMNWDKNDLQRFDKEKF